MKKSNQKGFGAIEILLIIIIILVLGFIGWFVWQRQSDDSTGNDRILSGQQSATSQHPSPANEKGTIPKAQPKVSNVEVVSLADVPANLRAVIKQKDSGCLNGDSDQATQLYYDPDVAAGTSGCGAYTYFYKIRDSWSFAFGTQGVVSCSKLKQYNISAELYAKSSSDNLNATSAKCLSADGSLQNYAS